MARRIAASVVALIALLLGVVAVPLGLITAAHDRQVFRSDDDLRCDIAGQRRRREDRRP